MTNAIGRCVMIVFALLPIATVAEPIKLKMAYFASDREPPYISVLKPFADAVNEEARGIIEIGQYPGGVLDPGGVLGRSLSRQPQLVLDGVADMAWVNPGLTPDRFPDNDVMEFPGLFRNLREATLVYMRVVASGALRGYEDFFVIAAVANFPLMIHTRPPIRSLGDLRGKILRVNNVIEGSALKAIGIAPLILPVNELALAIGRGTIDGASMPAKQAAFLEQVDGDQVQGFFFGRPIPASEVAASILAEFQQFNPIRRRSAPPRHLQDASPHVRSRSVEQVPCQIYLHMLFSIR
jgi:TRAP-type C4-dicarboxylate transport system substrate-binding protein